MNKFSSQKKIINIFFVSAVFLLLLNLVLDKFFSEEKIEEKSELTSSEIDSAFQTALFNLGIHEDWIKKQNENPSVFTVMVPKDLPVILILFEMNNVFDTNQVKILSVEKKIGGRTTIDFISGGEEQLKADFIYNDKIKRKSVRVGFLVKRDGNSETDSLLLEYPEQFAFLLIPSDNSKEFVKNLTKKGKEYIVYLNDDINELKFKLSDDYSPARLKNSIREIVGTFTGAVFFMIDNNSLLYSSKVFTLLKDELEKRKIKLIEESSFNNIGNTFDTNPYEIFNNTLDNLEAGVDKILIIPSQNFLELNYEIVRYRKLGYRFTNPSALL